LRKRKKCIKAVNLGGGGGGGGDNRKKRGKNPPCGGEPAPRTGKKEFEFF